jgi:hypothetical protein
LIQSDRAGSLVRLGTFTLELPAPPLTEIHSTAAHFPLLVRRSALSCCWRHLLSHESQ